MIKNKKILLFLFLLGISFTERSSEEIQSDINKKNIDLEKIRNEIDDMETEINSKTYEEKNNQEIIKKLYSARKIIYKQANYRIKCDGLNKENIAKKIISFYEKK